MWKIEASELALVSSSWLSKRSLVTCLYHYSHTCDHKSLSSALYSDFRTAFKPFSLHCIIFPFFLPSPFFVSCPLKTKSLGGGMSLSLLCHHSLGDPYVPTWNESIYAMCLLWFHPKYIILTDTDKWSLFCFKQLSTPQWNIWNHFPTVVRVILNALHCDVVNIEDVDQISLPFCLRMNLA